jgi:hypothetical protein
MIGDLPSAALRLMAQLPVRTHERKPAPPKASGNLNPRRGRTITFGKPSRRGPRGA